jgi:site-specific recombinase XerD
VSALPAEVVGLDALLDKRHLKTAIGKDIAAWLDWLNVAQKAGRTLDQYERDVAKFANMYPNVPLRKLTDAHILACLKTWPPASRYARSKSIVSFFHWALLTRRISRDPMVFVPKMRQPKQRHIETFTTGEVGDLLALPAEDAVLMAILFGAGLRKAEAINLQVRRLHVAEDPPRIVVIGGKGDKDRTVHPFPEKAEIIREFLTLNRLEPDDHLWYSKPGGGSVLRRRDAISSTSFHRWWTDSLDKAGVRRGAKPRERNPHIAGAAVARTRPREGINDLRPVRALRPARRDRGPRNHRPEHAGEKCVMCRIKAPTRIELVLVTTGLVCRGKTGENGRRACLRHPGRDRWTDQARLRRDRWRSNTTPQSTAGWQPAAAARHLEGARRSRARAGTPREVC